MGNSTTTVTSAKFVHMQGMNAKGQQSLPHNESPKQIVAGYTHTIVVLGNGTLWAWGSDDFGQCGSSNPLSSLRLREPVITVAAGGHHTACITQSRHMFTWGKGTSGQLGYSPLSCVKAGNEAYQPTPRLVESLQALSDVACGADFTLVLAQSSVFSFGNGSAGCLGFRTCLSYSDPICIEALTEEQVIKLACGNSHCLALTFAGTVYSWGRLSQTAECVSTPRRVDEISHVIDIACGAFHCAVLTNEPREVITWGENRYSQLGHQSEQAAAVGINKRVRKVACGYEYTVALLEDGIVLGWGDNSEGQLGSYPPLVSKPTVLTGSHVRVTDLACGGWHMIMLCTDKQYALKQSKNFELQSLD